MELTVQIVNFRSRRYLERCLFSIGENLPAGIKTEVLIVNNDEEPLENFEDSLTRKLNIRTLNLRKNVGFGPAHNAGFRISRGKYILLLNPDTKIFPGALKSLLGVLEGDENVGIAGPLLVDSAGKTQPDCFGACRSIFSTIRKKMSVRNRCSPGISAEIFETDWVSGGAMLVRRDVFEKLKGFDEKYFMYFEDLDLCLRVKKLGYKVAVNPRSLIFHESGKSFASEREKKRCYYASQDYYFRKHFGPASAVFAKLMRLPYYAKNVWLGH